MIDSKLAVIWVYLSASPLFGLTATLVAYVVAYRLYVYARETPLLNPVIISVVILIFILLVTGISYQEYFEGGQFIHFLLGPATVALAVPLYNQFSKLKKQGLSILITLITGVVIGALSVIGLAWALGASLQTQLSLAAKSVTAPVAMGIAEKIGGLPALTAIFVVMTGIIGAAIGTKLFDLMKITDDSVKGIAMGVAAHGIGTARAFQISSEMGAFSGLAMALSAFSAAIILPWLVEFIGRLH